MDILENLRGILSYLKYVKDINCRMSLSENEHSYYQGQIDILTAVIDMIDNDGGEYVSKKKS